MPTFREDTHRGEKVPLIKTEDIDDQAVTSEKIADEAVTNEKIGSKAVTEGKMAADSVGTEEIINQSVTAPKIADGSVTIPKLGNDVKQYLAEEKAAREKADKTFNDRLDAAVSLIVEQEDSSVTIKPGVLNHWGSPVTTLNITLADGVEGEQNDYKLQFKTGTDTPKITFPSNVKWSNGEADWEPNTTYEVSILNGLAIAAAWEDEG
jgi:hypothetical protein